MKYPTQEELHELSPNDRLKLLEDVWDTFFREPASLPLSEEHEREIDRRLESWQRDKAVGATWTDVRQRITKR